MTDHFNAFEMSPVPDGPDAVAPGPFLGVYAMPMFVRIATRDMAASTEFWVRGLGFVDFFSIPGQIVHLRRWAFQDVLLVPAEEDAAEPAPSSVHVFVSCVLGEIESVAAACTQLVPGSVTGPYDTAWRTRDIAVVTPEGTQVTFTAAMPFTADSDVGRDLASVGILAPDSVGGGQ